MTNKFAKEFNSKYRTHSNDNDIKENDKFKEKELKEPSSDFPTVIYNVYETNVSLRENVNVAALKSNPFSFFPNLIGNH